MAIRNPSQQFYDRNELSVYSSSDMKSFKREAVIVSDDLLNDNDQVSVNFQGFQQPAFIIEGRNMTVISRTAYGSFDNYHDANIISTHRYVMP